MSRKTIKDYQEIINSIELENCKLRRSIEKMQSEIERIKSAWKQDAHIENGIHHVLAKERQRFLKLQTDFNLLQITYEISKEQNLKLKNSLLTSLNE